MPKALIFDFDGVVADSEPLANTVLAELLTAAGAPTTLEQSYERYVGKQAHEIVAAVKAGHGLELPADFLDRLRAATFERFRQDLQPVVGVEAFIDAFAGWPKAIASSSAPDRLALSLDVLGLAERFGRHVYSAQQVPRGKPFPDLFLMAADALGAAPADCLVLEDSPSGVQAGRAAGMTVIGVLAGGHIRPGHAERLRAAGADFLTETFEEAARAARGDLSAAGV